MNAASKSKQYIIYCIVGTVIGVVAVVVRELLEFLLPHENPVYYGLSVMIVYAGGIIAGYYGHRKYTFGMSGAKNSHERSFPVFALIAVFGMILTTLLAMPLMYVLEFRILFQRAGGAISFATAVITVSIVTYSLNARFAFNPRDGGDSKIDHGGTQVVSL